MVSVDSDQWEIMVVCLTSCSDLLTPELVNSNPFRFKSDYRYNVIGLSSVAGCIQYRISIGENWVNTADFIVVGNVGFVSSLTSLLIVNPILSQFGGWQ